MRLLRQVISRSLTPSKKGLQRRRDKGGTGLASVIANHNRFCIQMLRHCASNTIGAAIVNIHANPATDVVSLEASWFRHYSLPWGDRTVSATRPASSSRALISTRNILNSSRLRSMKLCVSRDFSRMPFGVRR